MVSDYEAYKLYMAVKLHFTTSYDVFKYNGKINCPIATFNKRNDRKIFARLAERFSTPKEIIDYYVANFAYGNKNIIYSADEADDNHEVWLKRKESRTYEFSKQMNFLLMYLENNRKTYHELFDIESGIPDLLKLYVGGELHLETLVIIDEYENFLPTWEPLVLIWGDQLQILNKVKRFVKFDKNKLQYTYLKHKTELLEVYHGTYQ
jgi:hypothetical protein